jgi:hypothetical protein
VVSNDPPAILYYRVIAPTSQHFTRVGLCLGTLDGRLVLLFPDGKRADFAADEVEAYRAWRQK